ncbi:MAG: RsmF rRNA methyltransferase first C-terminal domain-containing protein [Chloroflexota bacterium]|nr:RsmF rRNA methyltransferase first C-terminal domain-containing protein [Chloroflexota bacterium]
MPSQLPPLFLARMQRLLGDEYPAFLASYDAPPSVGLRINTQKIHPDQFKTLAPFSLTPVPGVPAGFVVPPDTRPGKHPYHTAGLYYLQDPSAMMVAQLMSPQPGQRVLDLAAAPGGKTTHIAALMQGQGILIANDIDSQRAHILCKNLDRWGTRNTIVLSEPPSRLADHFGAYFDRVLIDAPCSGEGMFRKAPSARAAWRPQLVQDSALQQDAILEAAARLVRPGGLLAYATCTFAPEENEGTIARFLRNQPQFTLETPSLQPGFSPGRPEWLTPSKRIPHLERTLRLWPHKTPGEGHFIALLRHTGESPPQPQADSYTPSPIPRDEKSYFEAFSQSTLNWTPPKSRLALMGSYLYAIPPDCPNLRGLNVIRWGWWLGIMKKKRFEPSHALGAGLRAEDVGDTLPLSRDDPATSAYLSGQVLPSRGPKGWVLITVDGFPLGWGKRVQGRLKPHFPTWLRQF